MTLGELSDIMDVDIVLRRYANQAGRWTAQFEHVETKKNKNSSVLEATYGNGSSPAQAITDYVHQIRGKILICNAMSKDNRQELFVPTSLEV